jgi:hypothetical protein
MADEMNFAPTNMAVTLRHQRPQHQVFDGWAGEMNFAPTNMAVTLRHQRPQHQVFDGWRAK